MTKAPLFLVPVCQAVELAATIHTFPRGRVSRIHCKISAVERLYTNSCKFGGFSSFKNCTTPSLPGTLILRNEIMRKMTLPAKTTHKGHKCSINVIPTHPSPNSQHIFPLVAPAYQSIIASIYSDLHLLECELLWGRGCVEFTFVNASRMGPEELRAEGVLSRLDTVPGTSGDP